MSDIIASSESSKPKIKMGSSVKLHFALLMPSGEEIDTTRRGSPASLVLGDGNLLPGFDAVLVGLQEGDDVQLTVLAEDAFGARNEANIRVLAKSTFAQMDSQDGLEQGLVVSFQAPDGELPGVVVDVYEDTVKVDFNHPLSGKDIIFDVSILSVDEPMANEAGQIN
ncbi:MAG: FKBP-type peptidyl-prolyl cis-trans isomerase SlpA [Candidatus Azotimanducaceae bacterium]|jgi:FKBP-type peptidyl-prolyl cis-trans isomerase SlpA|tara:strand:- start:8912 stop:9412 length:501 start_codon:yes stop_codon:yes gene_type:complete